MTINDQIKQLCRDFDGHLHCSASANEIYWHALQCRQKEGQKYGQYDQEMRSEPHHPTPESAIVSCLASEWKDVVRK
jgi:hypothetical protein